MTGGAAKLTIILGVPASGKTTLARRLASDLSRACICKDDIKEGLFDALGAGDGDWSRRLSDASFLACARVARAQLSLGLSCILDGNWRPSHSCLLGALVAECGCDAVQIWCTADPQEIVRRFTSRRRHAAHPDGAVARAELEAWSQKEPEFIDLPGARRVFRADSPQAYAELLRELSCL